MDTDAKYRSRQSRDPCQSRVLIIVVKTSASVLTVFVNCALVMVNGGVKLMTLACSPSGKRMKPRCNMFFDGLHRGFGRRFAVGQSQFDARHQAQTARLQIWSFGLRNAERSQFAEQKFAEFRASLAKVSRSISPICASAIAQPTGWPRKVLV